MNEGHRRTRKGHHDLLGVFGVVLGTILAIAGLTYLKQRTRVARANWANAAARIEDTRTRLVRQSDSKYGGRMLYQVEVLAAFSMNGSHQERWIPVEQAPKTLTSAQFEEAQWKGSKCVVRWNPSNPREMAVELRQFPELR